MAELVSRLKAHEPKALAELYDHCGHMAYSIILRIVCSTSVAEDLTQETFLRVWNRVQCFDLSRGALLPWVAAIARNRAIDYLRSGHGRVETKQVSLERLVRFNSLSAADSLALSMHRSRCVQGALESLSAVQKSVVELAYFQGMSHAEIAEQLNQPLGTVKTWIRGALHILRASLAQPPRQSPSAEGHNQNETAFGSGTANSAWRKSGS